MINLSVNRLTGVPESLEVNGTKYELRAIPNKPPERKPIVTLQGKEMFEGDKYWWVSDSFEIGYGIIEKSLNMWKRNEFHSSELAEQYIRDNKPVYPAGLVDDLIEWWDAVHLETIIRARHNPMRCKNIAPFEIFDKLKTFKKSSPEK